MKLAYKAYDAAGQAVSGTFEAASTSEGREALRRKMLFVTEIAEAGTAVEAAARSSGSGMTRGQRLRHLTTFSRQLHVLVSSGTPLVQALCAIERQCEHDKWRRILADLRRRVEEGAPLSSTMRLHPDIFDPVCRSLISAGESSGNLSVMLDRLATICRKQLHLRHTVIGALVYPTLLIAIGFCVLLAMLLFVLPRFSILFESLDTPLPPTTQALMWVSQALRTYWWAALVPTLGAAAALYLRFRSEAGQQGIHALMLNLPKVGRLSRSLMSARLSRMMGTLLESRVPLLEAMQLTRQAVVMVPYAKLFERAEQSVSRGEPVSSILCNTDLIAACVQEALRNGEASGNVGQPLIHMADFLDEENDVVVKSLTSIIEPLILIVLGVVVGFIALSMFLPLFDLVSAANGGAS